MRTRSHTLFRYCAIAACAVVFANGCTLDRRPLLGSWAKVEPAEFCPGDTLRASYDLLGADVCPAGVDCSPYFPNVAISSAPTSFPATSINNYVGGIDFTPAGDRVDVTFDIDRDNVLIPTDRFDGSSRIFIQRTPLVDRQITVTRITGTRDTELIHEGMCAGSSGVNAPAELPGLPRVSPNMRLVQLCNTNGVPVVVTLNGSAAGASYTQTLSPGECLDPTMPGVPAGIDSARVVDVRPMFADPGTRCTATGPNNPPPTLRTLARMACR